MNIGWLEEDLRRAAPDHHHAIDGLTKCLDVGAHLVRKVALVLALLDVRAAKALHVVLIEYRRQRLDGLEIGFELLDSFLFENLGMRGRLVDVVFEDVPAGEDDVIQTGERNEILDQRRLVIGALAQANGAHLGERANRFGETAPHRFHSSDHRGGYGAQSHHHDSQLSCGGIDFCSGLRAALHFVRHGFS